MERFSGMTRQLVLAGKKAELVQWFKANGVPLPSKNENGNVTMAMLEAARGQFLKKKQQSEQRDHRKTLPFKEEAENLAEAIQNGDEGEDFEFDRIGDYDAVYSLFHPAKKEAKEAAEKLVRVMQDEVSRGKGLSPAMRKVLGQMSSMTHGEPEDTDSWLADIEDQARKEGFTDWEWEEDPDHFYRTQLSPKGREQVDKSEDKRRLDWVVKKIEEDRQRAKKRGWDV